VSAPRVFTIAELSQALTVEIIRRLWAYGNFRSNPTLKAIHENWFHVWVEWKTDLTMRDVDRQIEEMFYEGLDEDWADDWIFDEETEGETPLGGEMRISAPFPIEDNKKDAPEE